MTTKTCEWDKCDEEFTTPHTKRFCSKSCQNRHYRLHGKTQASKKFNKVKREGSGGCKRCGADPFPNRYWCKVCHGEVSIRLNCEFAEGFDGEREEDSSAETM